MKSKGTLVLIEQAVMLTVFALASVLCLRAFVWADTVSKEISAQDQAMIQAQNAAEVLKSCTGDGKMSSLLYGGAWDGTVWTIHYDKNWAQSETPAEYRLTARPITGEQDYLGTALIQVFHQEVCLVHLDRHVAWQEVTADE